MKPEFKLFADADTPHPCCVPGKQRAVVMAISRKLAADRLRMNQGSTDGMVKLDGGRFWMGTDYALGFPQDGEGPVRDVTLDSFYVDARPVTNEQFREFISKPLFEISAAVDSLLLGMLTVSLK